MVGGDSLRFNDKRGPEILRNYWPLVKVIRFFLFCAARKSDLAMGTATITLVEYTRRVEEAVKIDPGLWTYVTFREALSLLDPDLPEQGILSCRSLRLFDDGRISPYYAPFDQLNEDARIVLVGITPGRRQMWEACLAARRAIGEGASDDEVLRVAKNTGSFAGPMRAKLIRMLDDIGVAGHFGVQTCASLFSDHAKLVFSTSLVSFPVFVRGKNYTGNSPPPLKHAVLRKVIETVFVARVTHSSRALVVPLGKTVSTVVEALAGDGKIDLRRCLMGFPHPSGGNGHRVRIFKENRDALRRRIEEWFASA